MRGNVYLKSALRQPVRTLFLLLLVGVISFMFVARATEYIIVQKETDRLGGYYRSIGSIQTIAPFDPLASDIGVFSVAAGAELVSQSPNVVFEDRRRYCSGVMDGVYNTAFSGLLDESGGKTYTPWNNQSGIIYSSDVVVCGELVEVTVETARWSGYGKYLCYVRMKVDRVDAGYPDYAWIGKTQGFITWSDDIDALGELAAGLEVGERYLVRGYMNPDISTWMKKLYSDLLWKKLTEDGPLLLHLETEPGAPVDYTEPGLEGLLEDVVLLNENQRAMCVVGTKDMSAMPSIQEDTRINSLMEGRWLTRDDDINENPVCVVNKLFADTRGLKVGDKLKVTLRDLTNPYFYGFILEENDPNWSEYPTYAAEFEIVGLYTSVSTSESFYMYIPDSCMPAGVGEGKNSSLVTGGYSFELKSAEEQDAFIGEYREALAELGLTLTFVENDGASFWASVTPMRQSAAVNAGVFGLVLVLSMVLSVFLYLRGRRRDFAILRALGMPKGTAVRKMLLPIAFVGILGIIGGGVSSWNYALGKAAETLASVPGPDGVEVAATLSYIWLAALCAGAAVLMLGFTFAGARLVARRPALELLQGTTARIKNKTAKKTTLDIQAKLPAENSIASGKAVPLPAFTLGQAPVGEGGGHSAAARYVFRHMRRSVVKSALTAAVALCFVLALGWMSRTIEFNKVEIDRLYDTTVVNAEIMKVNPGEIAYVDRVGTGVVTVNFIGRPAVQKILNSGYIQDVYFETSASIGYIAPPVAVGRRSQFVWDDKNCLENITLLGFNRAGDYFSGTGHGSEPEYAEGYDESFFRKTLDELNPRNQPLPVLLPDGMMEYFGLELGDTVYLVNNPDDDTAVACVIAGKYTGKDGVDNTQGSVLVPLSALDDLRRLFNPYDELRITDPAITMTDTSKNMTFYAIAKFNIDPAKNRELDVFREEMGAYIGGAGTGLLKLRFVVWDEELRKVVGPLEKNLRLMTVLYPVTIAVSALIAAGLALLLMFQNAKEAAVMRVLGIQKRRARTILCVEQALLCVLGLLIGLAALAVIRRDISAAYSWQSLACAGLYLAGSFLGSLFSAMSVTNRMPLELLQVKE